MERMMQTKRYARSEMVYTELKNQIINLGLQMGEPLAEESLSERFKVSRTPIREALFQLEKDGFVQSMPRKGFWVRVLSVADIEEIYLIREALEGISAGRAATLLDQHNIEYLEERWLVAEALVSDGDRGQALEVSNSLHETILRVGGNNRVVQIINNLRENIQRLHIIAAMLPGRLEQSSIEHHAILLALKQRDPVLAEQAMRKHIASTSLEVILKYRNEPLPMAE